MSQPLSPAAQAVLDAFNAAPPDRALAAALRALANQVVPPPCSAMSDEGTWRLLKRHEILAIAAELKNNQ